MIDRGCPIETETFTEWTFQFNHMFDPILVKES